MKTNTIKVKKGGIDSIIAFIVVLLPLVYILIFMVATLYHFAVQMHLNQVVKETLVMASTYGDVTQAMHNHLVDQLNDVMELDESSITYYVRKFQEDGSIGTRNVVPFPNLGLGKADLLGIHVKSAKPSLLGTVSNFNIFGAQEEKEDILKYSAYREEIIRNDPPD